LKALKTREASKTQIERRMITHSITFRPSNQVRSLKYRPFNLDPIVVTAHNST